MAQHWAMLIFESLSAGVLAIFVGFLAVLAVVGAYVLIVWPLTFWDLANLGLEQYSSWVRPILWLVFTAGSLVGYVFFSGHIFKKPAKVAAGAGTPRPRR